MQSRWIGRVFVVYFDQRTGAPHAVCWSKSIFNAETTFLSGVDQLLGENQL